MIGIVIMNQKNTLNPILKWVGGKRQLFDSIISSISDYTSYYEPFVGGAAVLFELQPKKTVISDQNIELINIYNVIKYDPDELIEHLKKHKMNKFEDYFYQVRSWNRNDGYSMLSGIGKVTRIIYLNRTCYSGLY